jgi:hypothetical protein
MPIVHRWWELAGKAPVVPEGCRSKLRQNCLSQMPLALHRKGPRHRGIKVLEAGATQNCRLNDKRETVKQLKSEVPLTSFFFFF